MKKLLIIIFVFQTIFSFGQSSFYFNQDLPCVNKQFNIFVHAVNNMDYETVTEEEVKKAIDYANEKFAPICISFKFCEMDTVFDYNFNRLDEGEKKKLSVLYTQYNRINLFALSKSGTLYRSFLKQATFGSIDSINNSNIFIRDIVGLPQALGIFFGLSYTFEGNGKELVNGSNCITEGDKICDTPADPYTLFNNPGAYVSGDCIYRFVQQDKNGDYYLPDVTNIMSIHYHCHCKFSIEQYKKMAENYYKATKKHW